jgi:hypothetical protein
MFKTNPQARDLAIRLLTFDMCAARTGNSRPLAAGSF